VIRVPAAPTARPPGARRHPAGTGRVDGALRRDLQDYAEPARTGRRRTADAGRARAPLRRGFRDCAEPARTCRRLLPADAGRVHVPLPLGRHEVTLGELTPVADEILPWRDERRPGREAA
jgi:hypothetical protein